MADRQIQYKYNPEIFSIPCNLIATRTEIYVTLKDIHDSCRELRNYTMKRWTRNWNATSNKLRTIHENDKSDVIRCPILGTPWPVIVLWTCSERTLILITRFRGVLTAALFYLSCVHYHRMMYNYGSYTLDVTGKYLHVHVHVHYIRMIVTREFNFIYRAKYQVTTVRHLI